MNRERSVVSRSNSVAFAQRLSALDEYLPLLAEEKWRFSTHFYGFDHGGVRPACSSQAMWLSPSRGKVAK
jgi:hypothetical protein